MDCTPNQAWEANLHTKRTAPAETLEVLLRRRIGPLKVTKNGVRYMGVGYGQYDLGFLLQQEVYIRVKDENLNSVSVWDAQDKFVCLANSNRRLAANASHADLREGIAEKRRHIKLIKGAQEARLRLSDDLPDRVNRAAALRNQALQAPTPANPTISPIRSPIEGSMKRLQAAQERETPAEMPDKERFDLVKMMENLELDAPRQPRGSFMDLVQVNEEEEMKRYEEEDAQRKAQRDAAYEKWEAEDEAEAAANPGFMYDQAARVANGHRISLREKLAAAARKVPTLLELVGGDDAKEVA